MRFRQFSGFFLFFFCGFFMPSLHAEDVLQGTCQIDFIGSSTMGDFFGKALSEAFQIRSHDKNWTWSMRVPVEKMDTQNSTQNKKMFRMFDSEEFPYVRGEFTKVPFALEQMEAVPFTLTIKGISQSIVAQVKNKSSNKDQTSFDLEFIVPLNDFNLKRPSFLGFLKVGETVQVFAHFTIFHHSNLGAKSS